MRYSNVIFCLGTFVTAFLTAAATSNIYAGLAVAMGMLTLVFAIQVAMQLHKGEEEDFLEKETTEGEVSAEDPSSRISNN